VFVIHVMGPTSPHHEYIRTTAFNWISVPVAAVDLRWAITREEYGRTESFRPTTSAVGPRRQVAAAGDIPFDLRSDKASEARLQKAPLDSMKPSFNGSVPCPESSRHLSRRTCLFKVWGGARG
jgi:hypothetical protein